MVDKINEKIYEAKSINKEIDKIILTPDEWEGLRKELLRGFPYIFSTSPADHYSLGGAVARFNDIPIFVE